MSKDCDGIFCKHYNTQGNDCIECMNRDGD